MEVWPTQTLNQTINQNDIKYNWKFNNNYNSKILDSITIKKKYYSFKKPKNLKMDNFSVDPENLPSDPFFIYYNINVSDIEKNYNMYFQSFIVGATSDDYKYLGAIFNSDIIIIPIDQYNNTTDLATVVFINPIYFRQIIVPDDFMKCLRPTINKMENINL